jgi:hypothetical protein
MREFSNLIFELVHDILILMIGLRGLVELFLLVDLFSVKLL